MKNKSTKILASADNASAEVLLKLSKKYAGKNMIFYYYLDEYFEALKIKFKKIAHKWK